MKKKYIVFGLLAISSRYGFSQPVANPYPRIKVPKSTIQVVYGQYMQHGNHSAITGGSGTEYLQVYAPEIIVAKELDSISSYSIDAGLDVISSASMDKIDFVMSSASRVSSRAYIILDYDRNLKGNKNKSVGARGYFSIESAYLSLGGAISFNQSSKDLSRSFSAELEAYFDDLRWGRLNGERPLQLVYPSELRYKQWFQAYQRESFNLNLSFQQTLNKRMVLAFLPGVSYQHGLLSTPYHRVYFEDDSEKVENFPENRWKIPLGVQLNSFIGDRYILRAYYRFYWDDFGIVANTISLDAGFRVLPGLIVTPSARFYTQTAASYFRSFRLAALSQKYYTSDYDLADFNAWELALEANLAGIDRGIQRIDLSNISFRYSFYQRTDGLYAHMISTIINMNAYKKSNKDNALQNF